jgi:hypothetical protein
VLSREYVSTVQVHYSPLLQAVATLQKPSLVSPTSTQTERDPHIGVELVAFLATDPVVKRLQLLLYYHELKKIRCRTVQHHSTQPYPYSNVTYKCALNFFGRGAKENSNVLTCARARLFKDFSTEADDACVAVSGSTCTSTEAAVPLKQRTHHVQ